LPFSCKPAAESAPRFYTMSLRPDRQLHRREFDGGIASIDYTY
jgi:hypothetical protein